MNKAEFISAIAEKAGSDKSTATSHIEAMIEVVTSELKGGNEVALVGFGTFKAKNVKQEQVEILERAKALKLLRQQYRLLKLEKHLKRH